MTKGIKREKGTGYHILLYTGCFAVFFFVCIFLYNLIWSCNMFTYGDGLMQQYPYFIYSGMWLRRLFSNIFVRHVFELPSWDMTLYGFDPMISFGNMILDPVNLLSVFVPVRYSEAAFNISIALKYWLSGLSFLIFCRLRKKEGPVIIMGSMIYVFSGIAFIGLFQANFINLFYLFPLLMAGVIRMWEEKKFGLYTLALAACTLYDYYFTYMMGLLVIMYCIIRFIFEKDRSVKRLAGLVLRFIVFTVIGIGIGIGISVPGILNMAGLDRLSVERPFQMFYSLSRCKKLVAGFFSFAYLGSESQIGIAAAVIPSIWCLYAAKKKDRDLKVMLAAITVSLFIPFIGSIFNGGNYACQRYVFGLVFLLSYLFVRQMPLLSKITNKEWIYMLILCGVYAVPCFLADELFGLISAISSLVTVFIMRCIFSSEKSDIKKKERLLIIPVAFSCMMCGFAYGMLRTGALGVEFGRGLPLLSSTNGRDLVKDLPEASDRRFDHITDAGGRFISNSSMIAGVNGYDFYHSNYDQNIADYISQTGLLSDSVAFSYRNLHGRNFLELLNGTYYLSVQDNPQINIPVAYSQDVSYGSDDGYTIYTPYEETSVAFFYDDTISDRAYMTLDPVSREEVMMTHMVIEDAPDQIPDLITRKIGFEIGGTQGVSVTEDGIYVDESGSYMILDIDPVSGCEFFFVLNGFDFITDTDRDIGFVSVTAELLDEEGNVMAGDMFNYTTANVGVYHPRDELAFNFNPFEGQAVQLKVTFGKEGGYVLDSIDMYIREADDIREKETGFFDHADIDDVSFRIDGNSLYIDTARDEAGYLYLAVPYSEGWAADDNGETLQIIKANTAFMAVRLQGGQHHVRFTYHTPYLKEGMIISAFFACVFIGAIIVDKKLYNSKDKG